MNAIHPSAKHPLQQSIEMDGRTIAIELSKTASKALELRGTPLLVEMELYFSCLIRKQVRFRDATVMDNNDDSSNSTPDAVVLNDQLHVRFCPVMTRACGKDYEGDEPPLTDFPIVNARAYVPRWLRIDYRKNQWQGEFGYGRSD